MQQFVASNGGVRVAMGRCSEHLARQVQKAQVHRGMLQATAQSRANNIFDKHAAARKNLSAGNFQFSTCACALCWP